MLRFNTYRSKRYLRTKFVEGSYLLASEGSDLELELLDQMRRETQAQLGDVAIGDAWKIERLNASQILIKPGDAFYKGLPFSMRSGKDQLVSGAILSLGTVPVGVTVTDDTTGLGKIVTFNDAAVTPSNAYKLVITAREEIITDAEDPFLRNSNLTESTAQKIRLEYKLSIVPNSLQTETPAPYRDETSASLSITDYPSVGSHSAPNFVNQVTITPDSDLNGELLSLNLLKGSEGIDGHDLELVLRNDPGVGSGIVLPNSHSSQQAFYNGTLIDSNGASYHVNAIFNDTVITQIVLRIDKEPDQPNPEITNTKPFSLIKREVFVTDDSNGSPQGRIHWPIAIVDFDSTDGITHQSKITDLRNVLEKALYNQKSLNKRVNVVPVNSGDITFDLGANSVAIASITKVFNGIATADSISSGTYILKNDSCLAFDIKYDGSSLEKGDVAITIASVAGNDATLNAVDLSNVALGNLVKDLAGDVFYITAIDDVNNIISLNATPATGAATIHLDSFQEGYVKDDSHTYIFAVRHDDKLYIADLELEDGETSQIGDGVSQQLLDFIGATGESDNSPAYGSNNYVTDGNSLVQSISDLDSNLLSVAKSSGIKIIGGGTFDAAISGTDVVLSFDNDMYLEIKGLAYSDNVILSSESPITFAADKDVAYVIPNLATAGPNLSIVVDTLDGVPSNAVVIARRDGNDIIIGSSSTRLKDGQSSELYTQMSDQNSTFIGSTGTADAQPNYSSDIRGTANESLVARLGELTDSVGDEQENRSAYLRSDEPITWTGTQLQFTTDIVLEIVNTKSGTVKTATIQVADSPVILANGESVWVLIDRSLSSENLTINLSGTTPVPAQTEANKDVLIIARRQDALGAGYIHLPLHKQVLEPGQTVRLGASGSGDGGGNEILETLKNHFIDATFDLLTPNIFKVDKNDKIDGASTGAYSLVSRKFEFAGAAKTMVSTNSLDPDEFLANIVALTQVELLAFWDSTNIDTGATYQVSRNGGLDYQNLTMEQVGSSELYRGILTFANTETNSTLLSQLTNDISRDLDATNQKELSQAFTVAADTKYLLKQLVLNLTKTGSPTGNVYVSICSDNAGDPDVILAESNAIAMSSLSTGNNTITLPDTYLAAGTYHIKLRTDALYKSSYSAGVTEISISANSTGSVPYMRKSDGTTWSVSSTDNLVYTLKGLSLDLRVKITSSAAAKLEGYGILYSKSAGNFVSGELNREIFHFSGDDNVYEFTLTKFVPNADLLKVYDVSTGQVYVYGTWTIQGQKIVFDNGQFSSPSNTVTLVFDQTTGGAYDNSDLNGLLLANNHLGSTDNSIDKSVNGRGIFLRRPDGTLREICIDDSDNIVVYSV